ncbi:MAG: ribosome biogenesis GTPase Der [Clostridia bacterium]|nr:ribosome biogenesis GTPase Der [Clostridia bacterium]
MALPSVVIAGRPNVGKSTLFNRLAGRRAAIVEARPGVTRDAVETVVEWGGRRFRLLDTGGLMPPEEDTLQPLVHAKALEAVRQAAVVLFLVDARAGVTPVDEAIADELRRARRPVLLVANKAESERARAASAEFYALGLGEPLPISAEHGLGIDDLLDAVVAHLPAGAAAGEGGEDEPAPVRVAIVGRPNVGKSSLVNRLLNEERQIVADLPGTTRDAVDVEWRAYGKTYVLIDTAGIRRRSRIDSSVEFYSVRRAEQAIARCDVALLVVDATEGVTEQDQRIGGLIAERGRAAAILLNKWDAVDARERPADVAAAEAREALPALHYAPIVTISARTGQRVGRLAGIVDKVAAAHAFQLSTPDLNRFLQDAQLYRQPPAVHGKPFRIYYGTQVDTRPPQFLLFVNDPDRVHFSYERYLENRLRETYDLEGTPIVWKYRARERRPAESVFTRPR